MGWDWIRFETEIVKVNYISINRWDPSYNYLKSFINSIWSRLHNLLLLQQLACSPIPPRQLSSTSSKISPSLLMRESSSTTWLAWEDSMMASLRVSTLTHRSASQSNALGSPPTRTSLTWTLTWPQATSFRFSSPSASSTRSASTCRRPAASPSSTTRSPVSYSTRPTMSPWTTSSTTSNWISSPSLTQWTESLKFSSRSTPTSERPTSERLMMPNRPIATSENPWVRLPAQSSSSPRPDPTAARSSSLLLPLSWLEQYYKVWSGVKGISGD